MRRSVWGVLLVAGLLVTTACEADVATRINDLRTASGVPALPRDDVLSAAARKHSNAMCAARAVTASPDAASEYDPQTAVSVRELVGSAPLDPSISDGIGRNLAATEAIWSSWQGDSQLRGTTWTDQGVGEASCSDGRLYLTAVLRRRPTIPATGLYASPQYADGTLRSFLGITYTQVVDYTGATVPMALDIYTPPVGAASPRPTVILIHGGAFVGGGRATMGAVARQWAIRGYTAVSIDYRLDPRLAQDSSPPKQLAAAANAIADAQESVRWLKAHASTYGIDTTRIAAVGYSAGGAISLGLSAVPDQHPGGPNAAFSPSITAAVSTGAYLTPGIDAGVLVVTDDAAPILMFHHETDVASNTGPYAFRTCSAYRDAGATCDYVNQPGEGHTADLGPGSVWWSNQLGPFVWQQLRLGT